MRTTCHNFLALKKNTGINTAIGEWAGSGWAVYRHGAGIEYCFE